MHPIELIQGWMAMNTHGDEQNVDLVPWGERRPVFDPSRIIYLDNQSAGLARLIKWTQWRLYEHAVNGWNCLALIDIVRDVVETVIEWESSDEKRKPSKS